MHRVLQPCGRRAGCNRALQPAIHRGLQLRVRLQQERLVRDKAEELMSMYQKSRVVVLDDQGRLAGVISLSDLARRRDRRETGEAVRDIKAPSPPSR